MFKQALLFTLVMTFSWSAKAGLILNGSFEGNDVAEGKWKWYTADKVQGWQGSNIEIWDNLFQFDSFDGSQHIELNSHGSNSADPFSIYQTFETVVGQTYELSFAYSARKSNDEAFSVALVDSFAQSLLFDLIDDHTRKQWSVYEQTFTATSNYTTLRFTSVTPTTRTVGNLIDAVDVTEVSEPKSIALLTLVMAALFSRKRLFRK